MAPSRFRLLLTGILYRKLKVFVVMIVMVRYGRRLTFSHMKEECDLSSVCKQLGARGEEPPPSIVTEDAISLLKRLLRLDYKDRITAAQALDHPFVAGIVKF